MMRRKALWILPITVLILAALACNFTGAQPVDVELAVTQTLAAREIERAISEGGAGEGDNTGDRSAEEAPPTETFTPEPAPPTITPTVTEVPSVTPTEAPCDRAAFISDVSVPDGTDYEPGENFVKTWRLRNAGTCTWTSGYDLVFHSGDAMDAPAAVQLTSGTVAPGATVDVSVSLEAPDDEGTYQGFFRIRSSSGVIFGIGDNADVSFWVKIDVVEEDVEPDLIVAEINFDPYPPTKNDSVVVRVKVRNTGGPITDSFTVKWWPGENYPNPATSWNINEDLDTGEAVTVNYTYAGYPSTYGSINTKAEVDTSDTIDESNEGNNTLLRNIKVDP
jgi:hypothetical protein